MIGQYRKNYREMYGKILEIVKNCIKDSERERDNFVDKIGKLVVFEYGLSHKAYNVNITSSPAAKTISEKTKAILKEISVVVSEYENNLLETELAKSQDLIDSYIKSCELDAESYCASIGLDINDFKRAKKLVSIYDKDQHAILTKEQKLKNECKRNFLARKVEAMAYLLENGVELENGETRNFDLIDYYEITDVEPVAMYSHICTKRLPVFCDVSKVKRFLNSFRTNIFLSNRIDKDTDKEGKLNETIKFAEKDENGKIIEGSYRVITREEKESLLKYLDDNNLPLTEGTYAAGIRRIKNNTFGLEEINKSSKNKQLILK